MFISSSKDIATRAYEGQADIRPGLHRRELFSSPFDEAVS